MDIASAIQELYGEKQKLERVIAALEELQATYVPHPYLSSGNRRGRKSMGAKERTEVSQRMKRYWANRRKAQRG